MDFLGNRIKKVRGKQTQAEFAELLGVPLSTLGRYERGYNVPDLNFLKDLCVRFDLSLLWLIEGTGSMYTKDTYPVASLAPLVQNTSAGGIDLAKALEEEKQERRELTQEIRKLWIENKELMKDNSHLREEVARLNERLLLGEQNSGAKGMAQGVA